MTLGIFYIVAAYFIRKGYLSLYIIGLIIFTLSTLLSILVFGWAGLFFHVIRLVLLGIIFGHLQYILILQKHEKALLQLNRRSSDLLDDI
jgi:asparagine N-glycosylation enzyme membrane subunit Stt3